MYKYAAMSSKYSELKSDASLADQEGVRELQSRSPFLMDGSAHVPGVCSAHITLHIQEQFFDSTAYVSGLLQHNNMFLSDKHVSSVPAIV